MVAAAVVLSLEAELRVLGAVAGLELLELLDVVRERCVLRAVEIRLVAEGDMPALCEGMPAHKYDALAL